MKCELYLNRAIKVLKEMLVFLNPCGAGEVGLSLSEDSKARELQERGKSMEVSKIMLY